MMYSVILCEGDTDQILISYYLEKTLGYKYILPEERKKLLTVNIQRIKGNWYKDNGGNVLLMLAVNGSDFSLVLARLFAYNSNVPKEEMFKRICVITDNDDKYAVKRIAQIQNIVDGYTAVKNILLPVAWNDLEVKSGFGEATGISVLFLLQPQKEYGNIETFILDMVSEANADDEEVIINAKNFIKGIKSKKYLITRGDKNKGELAAFFAVVSPRRVFAKIDALLKEIPWDRYTEYNEQYKLLNRINK